MQFTGIVQEDSVNPNTELWQERLKVVILLGLAGYFGYNIVSGDLTNYINERFAWFSYVALVLFSVLGIASALGAYKGYRRSEFDPTNDHIRISWSAIAITAIPLILGTLIPSEPLGAGAVNGDISLKAPSLGNVRSITKDKAEWTILDWLRDISNSSTPTSFNGKTANVVGFVYREPDFPEGTFMVARFTISCCVADASAIGLPVYAPDAEDIADGDWVQIDGVFEAGDFRGDQVPILQPTTLVVVEQPEHPYLYP
jgi:uncharacterized repeat protein (TIGR03943 family)